MKRVAKSADVFASSMWERAVSAANPAYAEAIRRYADWGEPRPGANEIRNIGPLSPQQTKPLGN